MNSNINIYRVKVVREQGNNLITGVTCQYAYEEFEVEAIDETAAYSMSLILSKLQFTGQIRRTFINGEEYLSNKF